MSSLYRPRPLRPLLFCLISHLFVDLEGVLIISAPTPTDQLHDLVLDEEEESLHAPHDEALEATEAAKGDGDLVRLVVFSVAC